MNIRLNGQHQQLDKVTNLQELLDFLGQQSPEQQPPKQFALALNGNFVPRNQYASSVLQEGDDVELLVPMQGG